MTDVAAPNLYELACADVLLTYATGGADGSPRLSFQDEDSSFSASGPEIATRPTDLGTEVTVTLEAIPDDHTVTLTLVLPDVDLGDGTESSLDTVLVETTTRTSPGGPDRDGQRQTYRMTRLHGTARHIEL